ncbi:MAG: hypothetical protein GY863_02660 [bacterium]|nr:hypothetical protein [bacterium]
MYNKYYRFIRAVSLNKWGKTGVILATSSFMCFLLFELFRMAGMLTNAYIGLITYMVFPLLFIIGLLFIPIGWNRYKKSKNITVSELLSETFEDKDLEGKFVGSAVFNTIAVLSILNVVFIIFLSTRMLGFMDSSVFCGTACHTVMNPEWIVYQVSPHARVPCVDCHVGEGVDAIVNAKLNGMRQIFLASFNMHNRPIPTPVHQLRPARETCEKCHWPEKFYGDKIKNITTFLQDRDSTPKHTTLSLKIDSGNKSARSGIHWHISAENEVRYRTLDEDRKKVVSVEVKQPDGSYKIFTNKRYSLPDNDEEHESRTLDCVDCHNRATHIYKTPERIVDELIESGIIDRSLPYVKRESLKAISVFLPEDRAFNGIENHMRRFYSNNHPDVFLRSSDQISRAVSALQEAYRINIHYDMKVRWDTYTSFLGHDRGSGCFRCHDQNLQDDRGNSISSDCTLCHSILAYDETEAFKYFQPVDEKDRNSKMHKYLREEFLEYIKK